MVKLNIELPEGFLDEEVRCGYTVTKQMKEVWAIELDLLSKFKNVCEKYNLTYYADSGTLIGAVRDNGFIPWDDDIDLVMPRSDYNKLVSIGDQEFKHPYFLQNTYSENNPYLRAHCQLRNSNTTGCINGDLNRNINRGIFIDIFPLDVIPNPNSDKFNIFVKGIKLRWKLLSNIEFDMQKHSFKGKIFHAFANFIVNRKNFKAQFHRYEKFCSKYDETENEYISNIAYSQGRKKNLWKRKWYDRTESVKFEFININIPQGYDGRLKTEYGEYMKPSKAPSVHGDVLFNTSKSYKDVL